MNKLLALAASAAAFAGSAHAVTVQLLPNYDSTFPSRCGGVACEQAVGEFRHGDNGTTAAEREAGLAINTLVSPAPSGQINVSGTSGLWTGAPRDFSMAYDSTTQDLSLTLDVGGPAVMTFNVNLSPTKTMYIRAAGLATATTSLENLKLNGVDLSTPSFSTTSNSYLEISNFNWFSDWDLTGQVLMSTASNASGSRPSVQFKLTDLHNPIPVPAAAWLMAPALAGFLAKRRRRQA